MEIGHIIPHIEALIFATDRPLGPTEITELINNAFGFMEDKITQDQVESALEGIVEKYRSEFYPFELRESGGGWQFLTKKEYHKTVAQLNGEKFLKRLSPAALETLAIIAYKQPITKGDIEAIRGVSCDYSIQKLLEKELIVIIGRNEELPGKPLVYATSKTFMDYFGLNSPDELPKLKEVFDENMVIPTPLHEGTNSAQENEEASEDRADEENSTEQEALHLDEESSFVVTENGELTIENVSAELNGDEPETGVEEDNNEDLEIEVTLEEDEEDESTEDEEDLIIDDEEDEFAEDHLIIGDEDESTGDEEDLIIDDEDESTGDEEDPAIDDVDDEQDGQADDELNDDQDENKPGPQL